MSISAILRLLLGLIAAFGISLRWMYFFGTTSDAFGRLMAAIRDSVGERPFFVAAIAATAVLVWTVWEAFRNDRITRYVDTLLIWFGATLLFHLVVVIVLTIPIMLTLPGWSGFFAPFLAMVFGVPITIVLVPARAWILQRRRGGDANLIAADAMSSVLIILLVVWTATVGWKWPETKKQRIVEQQQRIAEEASKAVVARKADRADGVRLIEACTYGDLRLVRMELEYGSPVNARGRRGVTPLIAAVAAQPPSGAPAPPNLDQRIKIIDTLLKAGADVNARDNDGFTALDYAVYRGLDQIAEQLRAGGGRSGKSL